MSQYTLKQACSRVLELLPLLDSHSCVLSIKMSLLVCLDIDSSNDRLYIMETNYEPTLPLDPISRQAVPSDSQYITQEAIASKIATLLGVLQDPSHVASVEVYAGINDSSTVHADASTSSNSNADVDQLRYVLVSRFTNGSTLDSPVSGLSSQEIGNLPDISHGFWTDSSSPFPTETSDCAAASAPLNSPLPATNPETIDILSHQERLHSSEAQSAPGWMDTNNLSEKPGMKLPSYVNLASIDLSRVGPHIPAAGTFHERGPMYHIRHSAQAIVGTSENGSDPWDTQNHASLATEVFLYFQNQLGYRQDLCPTSEMVLKFLSWKLAYYHCAHPPKPPVSVKRLEETWKNVLTVCHANYAGFRWSANDLHQFVAFSAQCIEDGMVAPEPEPEPEPKL